ncbi:hypothetical protein Q1695_004188 [Nippostrongylus brasiliensis]|nr:hypothetical protein Q1695_004188 [Nippostrongylus brasiliensis]
MMGSLSPSGKYTYEAETVKQFFRHSNEDLYQIRRLENGTVTGKPFHVRSYRRDSTETVLAFKWNPVNKNDFVFVNDYNLYYQMDPEKPKTAIDNKRRELSAAMVYQTGFVRVNGKHCQRWSDSGKYIAYMRCTNSIKSRCRENPITELYMYSLKTKKSVVVEPPAQLTNMRSGPHSVLHTEKDAVCGAEPTDFKAILASETGFFTILPRTYTDGNICNHVAPEARGYDIQSDTLTFTSAGGGLGTMRLYKITQATMANRLSISSLSSVVSDCDYSSYEVSPDGRRAALSCIQ